MHMLNVKYRVSYWERKREHIGVSIPYLQCGMNKCTIFAIYCIHLTECVCDSVMRLYLCNDI